MVSVSVYQNHYLLIIQLNTKNQVSNLKSKNGKWTFINVQNEFFGLTFETEKHEKVI